MRGLLITIDGPAGSGKTTVSRLLADRLGYRYIDTGALYRAVALAVRAAGVTPDDDGGLEALCAGLSLRFVRTPAGTRLLQGDEDLTDRLRSPEITMLASAVSARPPVREHLLTVQRRMGREGAAVFEGRDMGTVVFPDADRKFFLTADLAARARRRFDELPKADDLTYESVRDDMARRDQQDAGRALAPLAPAPDAIRIDTTHRSPDEVVAEMLAHCDPEPR
jgi:CMP/dCMP kinase